MEQNQVASAQPSTDPKDQEKRPDNDSRARRSYVAEKSVAPPPKPLTMGQRWNAFRPSKSMLLWSILGAVALTMLVGFTWGGWMTTSGAQELAKTTAKSAVMDRLAPICVAQSNLDPDRVQKIKELQESSTYERTKYVTEQGWATLPGETEPTSQVAAACANLLMQTSQ